MASQDVIELGSSDDEPDPVPKKAKPPPNAMVHIPSQLPGLTIKPTKSNGTSKVSKRKSVPARGLANVNANFVKNPYSFKVINRPNGSQTAKVLSNPIQIASPSNQNTMNLLKNVNNTQLNIKKVSNSSTFVNVPVKFSTQLQKAQGQRFFKLPPGIIVKKTSPTTNKPTLVRLPNSIIRPTNTMKPSIIALNRMQINNKLKRPATTMTKNVTKKRKMNSPPLNQVGDVLTVELDDDDGSQSSASPQWYLRPEDPKKVKQLDEQKSLEQLNNKEPEVPKYIEITIEDSPIKPPILKRTNEVQDASITIDDSPVKSIADKNKESELLTASGSDDEIQTSTRTPNSKKKLKYPKESGVEDINKQYKAIVGNEQISEGVKSIQIEIEPMEISETEDMQTIENSERRTETIVPITKQVNAILKQKEEIIIEIEESPSKKEPTPSKKELPRKTVEQPKLSTKSSSILKEATKIDQPQPKILLTDSSSGKSTDEIVDLVDDCEFHPIYQNFIDMCFKLENSEDMKKIVEKKIKTYYRQVPKEYTGSEEFLEMVSSKIMAMKAGPDKMYLYIKDIVDELNLQRKIAKSEVLNKEKRKELEAAAFYGEAIEQDAKRKRQVRKLEKTLKKLHRAIQKLEDQEVDFDDDGDSVYILTESEEDSPTDQNRDKPTGRHAFLQRYKERLVRVHAKLCQLSNTKMPSEPRVHVEPRPGQPAGPARRLEKWINRRVPVGTPLPFPDFHDVLRCVREANKEDDLRLNEADIMEEARDLFTRCGKKLQRRRQENEWRLAASRISAEVDPAEQSDDLKMKLDNNRKVAAQKEYELINKYADRQKLLKLEAVEIGDKEADESPVESGDDAPDDPKESDTLENREERKERLKRLLKEKASQSPKIVKMNIDGKQINETEIVGKENNVEKIVPEKSADEHKDKQFIENLDADKDPLEIGNEQEKSIIVELQSTDMEVEICAVNHNKTNNEEDAGSDSIHTLSDDSKKVDSDVDELHLLQKLHSGTDVATSTLESSDTDTPIAISDTLESNDGMQNKENKISSDDVVSIENSSYSESENTKDVAEEGRNGNNDSNDNSMDEIVEVPIVEVSADVPYQPKKQSRNSNEEYSEPVEDILLASSDEESNQDRDDLSESNSNFVNLKDDTISIGDTVVEGTTTETKKSNGTTSSSYNYAANTADDPANNNDVNVKNTERVNNSNSNNVNEKVAIESAETVIEEVANVNVTEPGESLPEKMTATSHDNMTTENTTSIELETEKGTDVNLEESPITTAKEVSETTENIEDKTETVESTKKECIGSERAESSIKTATKVSEKTENIENKTETVECNNKKECIDSEKTESSIKTVTKVSETTENIEDKTETVESNKQECIDSEKAESSIKTATKVLETTENIEDKTETIESNKQECIDSEKAESSIKTAVRETSKYTENIEDKTETVESNKQECIVSEKAKSSIKTATKVLETTENIEDKIETIESNKQECIDSEKAESSIKTATNVSETTEHIEDKTETVESDNKKEYIDSEKVNTEVNKAESNEEKNSISEIDDLEKELDIIFHS